MDKIISPIILIIFLTIGTTNGMESRNPSNDPFYEMLRKVKVEAERTDQKLDSYLEFCKEEREKKRRAEEYTAHQVGRALEDRAKSLNPRDPSMLAQTSEEFKNLDPVRYVEIWTARRNMPVLPWRIKPLVEAKLLSAKYFTDSN